MVFRTGETLSYDPFADDEESVIDSPADFEVGEVLEIDPFEGQDPFINEPQASDLDEPDDGGHSLWDIPRMMGKGAAGIAKTASLAHTLLNPQEWGAKAIGLIGDVTQNEAAQAYRDYSNAHGVSAKLQQWGETAEDYYDERLTPAMKASMEKTILSSGEEEGFFGEGIKDPWKIGGMIAESIPSTILSMGGGAVITKNLIQTGMKHAPKVVQGVVKKMINKYGVEKVAGVVGGAAGEGTYAGFDNANATLEEMMEVPQKEMVQSKAYREIFNALPNSLSTEKKHAHARKVLAMAAAAFVGSTTAVTTGILGAPSGAFMGKLIGGEGGKSLWGNLIKGAISEGFFEEMPQSGVERLVTNLSTKLLVDPNQELTEGVGEAMAGGAIAGFAMGGGMALAFDRSGKQSAAKDLLTDDEDSKDPLDILLGPDEAKRIRDKAKGRFKGPESIEADEEAGEHTPEDLDDLAEKPKKKKEKPDAGKKRKQIPGKKPKGEKPKPTPPKKQGPTAPIPGGVLQKPTPDEDQPFYKRALKKKPAQLQSLAKQYRDRVDQAEKGLKPYVDGTYKDLDEAGKTAQADYQHKLDSSKLGLRLIEKALEAVSSKAPMGDRRSLDREAEERRAEPERPAWDKNFRAIYQNAQKMDEDKFVKSGKAVLAGQNNLGFLDLAKRLGETIEEDTDIEEALKTIHGRIKAGMEPRKRTQEMTEDELRQAMTTDYLTGLRNKHAFDIEDTRKKHVVSIDLDSLKYFNDNFSHQTGDEMLINFGNALLQIGDAETYHISGDEFIVQSDDESRLDEILTTDIVNHLKKNPITVITPDGKRIKYEVQFSYGTAETISKAEEALHRHKEAREAAGSRAGRGEIPPGLPGSTAKGKQAPGKREGIPEKKIGGRKLFSEAQLALFDKYEIDVSKVPAKYKAEALQQLQLKTKHEGKTPEEYDAWVQAEYDRIKKAQSDDWDDIKKLIDEADETPADTDDAQKIEDELDNIDNDPTLAQQKAGNYRKGHFKYMGFNVTIENAPGEFRSGEDSSGKKWRTMMHFPYGYFARTEGKDGDEVDVFLGPDVNAESVFIVHQVDPKTGKPDEDKVMLGFSDAAEAKIAYLKNYETGWKGLGSMTAYLKVDFADWLDKQTKARKKAKPKPKPPEPKPPRPPSSEPSREGKWIEGHLQTPDRYDRWWTHLIRAREAARGAGVGKDDVDWNSLEAIVAMVDAKDNLEVEKPKVKVPIQGERGKETSIITPGNKRGYKAHYTLVEADDLIPSHNAQTFQKNPDYPEGIQERTYHSDKTEQAKVLAHAQSLVPRILLTDDPTPTNGPPIITTSGIVLGGNSRTMSLQLAYSGDEKQGKRYKAELGIKSQKYGLSPNKVYAFDKPVLVRTVYLESDDSQTLHRMASDFNKSLTQGMAPEAEIASMGKNISMETIEKIGRKMADKDLTIRELLGKKDGLQVLKWLIGDDVITTEDENRFINRKVMLLNDQGKTLVEKAIFGSIIDDPDLIDAAPKSLQNKIGRALPSLARIKARGEVWDITPQLKEALELATAAKGADLSIREFLKQGSLFGDKKKYDEIARALAWQLEAGTQTVFAKNFRVFAGAAMADTKGQNFLFPPRTFVEAFEEAFNAVVEEPSPRVSPDTERPAAPEPKREPYEVEPDTPAFEILRILRLKNAGLPDDPAHQGSRNASAYDEAERRKDTILSELGWPDKPSSMYYRMHTGDVVTLREALAGIEETTGPNDMGTILKLWNPLDQAVLEAERDEINVWQAIHPERKKMHLGINNMPTERKEDVAKTIDVKKYVQTLEKLIDKAQELRISNRPAGQPELPGMGNPYLQRIMSMQEEPTAEGLENNLSSKEFTALNIAMGFPSSGTKQHRIDRFMLLHEIRKQLQNYAATFTGAQAFAETKSKDELKQMAKTAKIWQSGNKVQLASVLLGWRDRSRRKGLQAVIDDFIRRGQEPPKMIVEAIKKKLGTIGIETEPPHKQQPKPIELSAKAKRAGRLADWVASALEPILTDPSADHTITWQELFKKANRFFEGTQAEGAYTPRDAYDAMELGFNQFIMRSFPFIYPDGTRIPAIDIIKKLKEIGKYLPTQSKRTEEQEQFQQYSTPPFLSYAANWVANIGGNDVYLEPSAGIGGLAIFGRMSNAAKIFVNELSKRRAELLSILNLGPVTTEDAIQLNNILPDHIKPTVIVMNPPFSSTAGRLKKNMTMYGAQHVEQALKRLEPGGRLVAIVGRGMEPEAPTFRKWWTDIKKLYNVRANIGISGKEYQKYGTTFSNRILVIDKTGPTAYNPVIANVESVEDLPAILQEIRDDRKQAPETGEKGKRGPDKSTLPGTPEEGEGTAPGTQPPRDESTDLGTGDEETQDSDRGPGGSPKQPDSGTSDSSDELPGPDESETGPETSGSSPDLPGGTSQPGDIDDSGLSPEETGELSLDDIERLFDEVAAEEGSDAEGPVTSPGAGPSTPPTKWTMESSTQWGEVKAELWQLGRQAQYRLDVEDYISNPEYIQYLIDEFVKLADGFEYSGQQTFKDRTHLIFNLNDRTKLNLSPGGGQETAPPSDYSDIADLINDADDEIRESPAPYGGKPEPIKPGVYAKAKPLLAKKYRSFMEGAKDLEAQAKKWLADAIGNLKRLGVNLEIAKNWIMHFYQFDRPSLKETIPPGKKTEAEKQAEKERKKAEKERKKAEAKAAREKKKAEEKAKREAEKKAKREAKEKATQLKIEKAKEKREELEEKLYQRYTPIVRIKGAKKHPTQLDESAALGDTNPPPATYRPKLPKEMIEKGLASDAQLEAVVYTGQAHEQFLPNGQRRGFFAGHGTGVGKGRIIASIIRDNWNNGRKKAIWISEKAGLFEDAKRDIGWDKARDEKSGIEWNEGVNALFKMKTKKGDRIKQDGIMFTTYSTLRSGYDEINSNEPTTLRDMRVRINQIVEWAGKDFDGVIAFDESHNMSNSLAQQTDTGSTDPSQSALAGVMLQQRLPRARIVYVSATAATEVSNLAYAERLGLWGEGTAFGDKQAFITAVKGAGLSAMELVARDLKAQGLYLAPTLSYDGVSYDKIVHTLDEGQISKYNELADAWQIVLQNINEAMADTLQNLDGRSKRAMWSAFWGGQQRFFNQVITTMQMGSGIKHMEEQIAKGNSCVLQMVNHGGSQLDRALNMMQPGDEVEDLELGPKANLLEYLENAFPIKQWEPYIDENGNEGVRPMMDSNGNHVINREALRKKEEMIMRIQAIDIPGSPLDMILHHFGRDQVAEITGRKRRIVIDPETNEMVVEKWSDAKSKLDMEAFLDNEKKILVFTEKGGTGASYHADINRLNQDKRIHYLVQPGWRADKAIQGLGRTHRSNQKQPPEYFLLTTNLDAQKRFISSIARRLDQLGALTKGQRQTGSQGIFQARDNMESNYAVAALNQLYDDIINQVSSVSLEEFTEQSALTLTDEDGNKLVDLPTATKMMNRLLTMRVEMQGKFFGEWSDRLDRLIDAAAAAGTLDIGIETITGLSIDKGEDRTVSVDEATGAKTRYVRLEVLTPSNRKAFEDLYNVESFYVNRASGKIWGATPRRTRTNKEGNVIPYKTLTSVSGSMQRVDLADLDAQQDLFEQGLIEKAPKWSQVLNKKDAAKTWNDQYAETPSTTTRDIHLMTGALLPIWDRLGGGRTVYRMQTDDGERFLGRVIHQRMIEQVLSGLGVEGGRKEYTGADVSHEIMENDAKVRLVNRWRLKRSRVSGENRIELLGPSYDDWNVLRDQGVMVEKIGHKTRYFVPVGENSAAVLDRIFSSKPVADLAKDYEGPRLEDTIISEPTDINKMFGQGKQAQMNLFGGNQENLFTSKSRKAKPAKTPQAPSLPQPRQVVTLQKTGDISHYNAKVENAEQAAGVVSFLAGKAAEEAYTIAVNKDGVVLQVHKVSKGTSNSASVPLVETGGTLLRAPGAKTIYFIHQHPSRSVSPSPDDLRISKQLMGVAALRDIKFVPIIMAANPLKYSVLDLSTPTAGMTVHELNPEMRRRAKEKLKTKLPVKERFLKAKRGFEKSGTLPEMKDSVTAKAHFKETYNDMQGVMFVDTKNVDLGFIPWPTKGKPIKDFAAQIIAEAERHNAKAMIFNLRGKQAGLLSKTRTKFLHDLTVNLDPHLNILDIIIDDMSMNDHGQLTPWKNAAVGNNDFLKSLMDDTVLFSRKVSKPTDPMSAKQVQDVIDPYLSEMKARPGVTVLRKQETLPEGAKEYLKIHNADRDIVVAAVHDGRVYLVAENIENRHEALRALFHEIMGHFGIHAILGDRLNKILDSVYIAKRREVGLIATEYGFDLRTVQGRRTAADEWLAREAETNPNSTWIDRVVAMIRDLIRRINPDLAFSDAEIRALIAKARKYVQTGQKTSVFPPIAFDRIPARADIWFSHMKAKFSDKSFPASGTASSYSKMLRQMADSGKIKREELEWSGVLDWLWEKSHPVKPDPSLKVGEWDGKVQPTVKIKKADLLKYLDANDVQIQEILYAGDRPAPNPNVLEWPQLTGDAMETQWENPVDQQDHKFSIFREGDGTWSLMVDEDTAGNYETDDLAMTAAEDWADDLKDEALKDLATVDWYDESDDDETRYSGQWYDDLTGESIDFLISQPGEDFVIFEDGEQWEEDTGSFDTLDEAKDAVQEYLRDSIDDATHLGGVQGGVIQSRRYDANEYTKHSDPRLNTPGGKNYKELLLTLPSKDTRKQYFKYFADLKTKYFPDKTFLNQADVYLALQKKATKEEITELDRLDAETVVDKGFYHNHWGQVKNVLAHVRFNERIDAEGRRTLFLEEIQSDLHQKGREAGYGFVPGKAVKLPTGEWTVEYANGGQMGTYKSEAAAEAGAHKFPEQTPPDMPFKQSRTWGLLLIKRMVRYAAENDFQYIAWTSGEMQKSRYNLSRVVQSISVYGRENAVTGEKSRAITMLLKKETSQYADTMELGIDNSGKIDNSSHEDFKNKQLSEVLGKDLASHIMAIPAGDQELIEGEGLDIGGRGMIEFYDKIIPNEINKFFGKAVWGKAKVEVTKIGEPGGDFQIRQKDGSHMTSVSFDDQAAADAWIQAKIDEGYSVYEGAKAVAVTPMDKYQNEVFTLPITGEMKAKALYEGMPMFMLKRPKGHGAIDVVGKLPENVKHRFAQNRGVPKVSWMEKMKEKIAFVKSQRHHFPDLYRINNAAEEDQLSDVLRQHQEVPESVKDQASRKIIEFTKDMKQDEYEIFRIHVILADMIRDIDEKLITDAPRKEGETLPFGFESTKQIKETYATFQQLAEQNPTVKKAIADRRSFINGLVKELVKFKILKKEVMKHKDYFHHQVLAYWAGKNIKTVGTSSADVRTHWRPWMAARKGSMMDYNTEYVEAEFAALSQQMAQIETARTLQRVKNISDIYKDLKTAAKYENLQKFYVKAAAAASKMFGQKITVAEMRSGPNSKDLDPLFPFRQNIAMASAQLEKMAFKDKLEVDSEWDDVVDSLAESWEIRKLSEEEKDAYVSELRGVPDGRYFAFLSYLIEKQKPGSSWAATTFKAIHGRNKMVKTYLGDEFITYRNLIPDGYIQWKPDPGKGWFWTNSVADDILQKIIAGEKEIEDKDFRQMLAKGQELIWVIPEGLAATLDNFRKYPEANSLGRLADWCISAWKMWVLINPRRWMKYNTNNMSGDMDITLAYAPAIAKPTEMKRAFSDARKWMNRKELPDNVQAELNNARRKGVLGSGFAVQEVEDVLNVMSMDKYVRHILLGEKPNLAMRYWQKAKGTTILRENVLRLSAYRWFRRELQAGHAPYGASKPSEIDNIPDMDDKAAKLARELIGDYGNISAAGQYIRRRLMPFYSWMEINTPRYVYLMRNLRSEDRFSDAAAVRRRAAGIVSKKVAVGGVRLAIKANLLMGAVLLYNILVHRDEWEELGEAKRRQLHLIIGRRDDGTIQTIRFQGALSDSLSWFALEDWPADVKDLATGQGTIQEKILDVPKAIATKAINAMRPEPKLLMESLTREQLYPDPFSPRPVRDTVEHVLRTFSLESIYRIAAGKPGRGKNVAEHLLSDLKSLLLYTSDPGEQAYYDTRKMVFDWLEDEGIDRPSGKPTNRSNALYYYRQALKYGDLKAAKRYLDKYYSYPGATGRTLRKSINRAHPLSSVPRRKRFSFRQGMTPKQQKVLQQALEWYNRTYKEQDLELRIGAQTVNQLP